MTYGVSSFARGTEKSPSDVDVNSLAHDYLIFGDRLLTIGLTCAIDPLLTVYGRGFGKISRWWKTSL